jgi:hypothetical protein
MELTFKEALNNNDNSLIKKFVNSKIDLNKLIGYRFPIFFLIDNDNLDMIEYFIKKGADINAYCCECSMSPINYAGQNNKYDVINLLISYGADISFVAEKSYMEESNYNLCHFNIRNDLVYWYYNWNPYYTAFTHGFPQGFLYVLQKNDFPMKYEYLKYFNQEHKTTNLSLQYKRNLIRKYASDALKKWSPERHYLFNKKIKNEINNLFLVNNRFKYLPKELCFYISEIICVN